MSIKIEEEIFGLAKNPFTNVPEMVRRFTMINKNQMSVSVIQLGAIIQSICMPDAYQKIEDVCLGFEDIASYVNTKAAYIGGTLGRVANRVANGEYVVGETKYALTKNFQNAYQLHGGFVGFDSVIWEVVRTSDLGITFKHVSPDGHEGYPGQLTATITYWLDNSNRFGVRFEATTTKTTPVNLSNHAYFNLAGHASGPKGLAEHRVEIMSSKVVDTDNHQIPTGNFLDVNDTVYDMRIPVLLGDRLKQFDNRLIKGYDNCFVVNENKDTGINLVAKLLHPPSGRSMEIYSNQPGLQFYTANNLPDEEKGDTPMIGKDCTHYHKHGSFCVETEKFPDSMNHPDFPSIFLNPGEKYLHEVIYKFDVEESWKCCCNNK
ncbi:galactose mutarotase [Drosophila grimshawi]|uniref:Aldose 1-epimerase n=1 Tax=Drosophila grimshawi TaxID=7222 RepID=B4IYT8_DROGR|nr:galactose mutarotase [Drosophila grimshawi]XP_032599040.1 galactose mutarotase [Drosophila grimshawi]EDV96625.1 GH16361 [Drosophila grimshawi]